MGRKTLLVPGDREAVLDLMRSIRPQLPTVGHTQLQMATFSEIERREAAGEAWAGRALHALACDGLSALANAVLDEETFAVRVGHNGTVMELPARVGVRTRDPHSGKVEPAFQQRLWWDLSWDELGGIEQADETRLQQLNLRLSVFRFALALRAEFPDTRTAAEAFARKGIDPHAFEIEDAV